MQRVPSPVVVRPATDADLPTAVRLRAQANPDIIVSLDGMRLWLSDAPENALLRMFLAERDGVAAGWAVAMRAWHQSDPTIGMVDVLVDEEHRRQGVGSALATQALQHVDAHGLTTVHGSAIDEPAPAAFAAGLGFVERSAASTSAVDPRTIEPLPVPAGRDAGAVRRARRPDAAVAARPRGRARHPRRRGLRRHDLRALDQAVLAHRSRRRRGQPRGVRRRRPGRSHDAAGRPPHRAGAEQPHRRPAHLPRPGSCPAAQDAQPGPGRRDGRDVGDHRQRRAQRPDAGGEPRARATGT